MPKYRNWTWMGFLWLVFMSPAPGEEQLWTVVLDVGEGQAVLLQQGERGVLIDTGPLGKARHVLDRLEAYGVVHLDYLFLTHLHDDHASGYFRIREAFPETTVIDNGQRIPDDFTPDTVRWVHQALVDDPQRRIAGAGDLFAWQSALIRVLWPEQLDGLDLNRNSLVLEVVFGKLSVLVMGDVDRDVEQRLMARGDLPDRVGLLVAGHHGSTRTAMAAFLRSIRPLVSVISINADNFRGYPDPETVTRLKQHSGSLFKTFRDGEICLYWSISAEEPGFCPKPASELVPRAGLEPAT